MLQKSAIFVLFQITGWDKKVILSDMHQKSYFYISSKHRVRVTVGVFVNNTCDYVVNYCNS